MKRSVAYRTALLAACCCLTLSSAFFTPAQPPLRPFSTRLYNTPPRPTPMEEKVVKEEPLSDLDARVLREMLQDTDKLDLTQEANLQKLLERGVAPKTAPSIEKEPEKEEGPYSSAVLKTLSDTKLWKGLKRDVGNIFETVGIFVANRLERDAKLLASVGLFAWERAVKDVARALPSSGTSGAAVGRAVRTAARRLGNSSSFEEMQEKRSLQEMDNLYEELNTPMDEIRSVSQSIRDILKGESVSASTGRGLRSVAPAGQGQNAERQRRAYRRRKMSTLKQEREVLNPLRAAGSVIDTAAEMKRELQVESSKPGYRSEGARKAIAAGAAETRRILAAAKQDGWSKALFSSATVKQENIRELVGSDDIESIKETVDVQAVVQLMEEQKRVVDRLNHAIHEPGETWLTPDVVKTMEGVIDEDALRDVVTAMICARDDLEAAEESNDILLTAPEMVEKLQQVKSTVDMIVSRAASCAGFTAAERLSDILYGKDEKETDRPSLLTLDEVEPSIAAAVEVAESLPEVVDDQVYVETSTPYYVETSTPYYVETSAPYDATVERTVYAEVVSEGNDRAANASPRSARKSMMNGQEVISTDFDKQVWEATHETGNSYDSTVRTASAEVISDDDFDNAVGAKRVAVPADEVESKEEENNPIAFILLRALDVILFILEKLFTTVIPQAVTLGSTVATRLADIGRSGMGSKGWKPLDNVQTGSKRY